MIGSYDRCRGLAENLFFPLMPMGFQKKRSRIGVRMSFFFLYNLGIKYISRCLSGYSFTLAVHTVSHASCVLMDSLDFFFDKKLLLFFSAPGSLSLGHITVNRMFKKRSHIQSPSNFEKRWKLFVWWYSSSFSCVLYFSPKSLHAWYGLDLGIPVIVYRLLYPFLGEPVVDYIKELLFRTIP